MLMWTGHSKSSTFAFTVCCMLHERSSETRTQFRVQKQQFDLLRGPKESSRDHIDSEWIKMAFCIRTQRLLGCKHEEKGILLALRSCSGCLFCFVMFCLYFWPGQIAWRTAAAVQDASAQVGIGLFAQASRIANWPLRAIDFNQALQTRCKKLYLHNVRTLRTQFETPQSHSFDTILQRRLDSNSISAISVYGIMAEFEPFWHWRVVEQCGEGNSFGLHFESTWIQPQT